MERALFIDRDGIINEIVERDGVISCPRNWDEVAIFPEADRLPELRELGYQLIMITNQPDIERGLLDKDFVEQLHSVYLERFGLDAVYMCPYASNSHPFKKPNPGMFLKAAKDRGIDLEKSFHLGDTVRDVVGAKSAGCRSILWDKPYNQDLNPDHRISRFIELNSVLSPGP